MTVASAVRNTGVKDRRLVVFLSHRGSLTRWKEQAILSRELSLYVQLIKDGVFSSIALFSYDARDRFLLEDLRREEPALNRLDLLTPQSGSGGLVYGILGVFRHLGHMRDASWLKTNQMSGSWSAVLARTLTGTPLMVRQGYSLSRRFKLNRAGVRSCVARLIEAVAYARATLVVTTSKDMADGLRRRPGMSDKVRLCPTFVDMEAFRAKSDYRFAEPVIYVGRLTEQKNILLLVEACRRAGLDLDLVGEGPLEGAVRRCATEAGSRIRLVGLVPNEDLAVRLRNYSVFALPSVHEGFPKALVEAMAVGLVCVGANTSGISDLIDDEVTGYLVDPVDAASLADRLSTAMRERRSDIGRNARALVAARYGLPEYARAEAAMYNTVLGGGRST